jgi:hypothetical protein
VLRLNSGFHSESQVAAASCSKCFTANYIINSGIEGKYLGTSLEDSNELFGSPLSAESGLLRGDQGETL